MKTKIYKIYKLTCLITGLSYIGFTHKKFIKRMAVHTRTKSYIGNALREHEVKNFKAEVLWETYNRKNAGIVEKAAICVYNTRAPNGYNILPGGEGGDTFTNNPNKEGIRKKLSESYQGTGLGNQNALGNKSTKGQHWKWPKELKEKMLGNKNAKGHKGPKGSKRSDTTKRNKESNPMKNPATVLKCRVSCLKNKISKLENELRGEI